MLSIPSRELRALATLTESGVKYLLFGGRARQHYGINRQIEDVDLFVGYEPENATRLWAAIVNIVGHFPAFRIADLGKARKHIRLLGEDEPKLDMLTSVPGLDFATAFNSREVVLQDAAAVSVMSKDDLIGAKRAPAERDPRAALRRVKAVICCP